MTTAAILAGWLISTLAAYAFGRRGAWEAQADARSYRICYENRHELWEKEQAKTAELRAELSAAENRSYGWKRDVDLANAESDRLRLRISELERRLVKFNHTIDPTAAELALERVQRAREQHDTARAEWQRVRQETK